MKNELPDEQRVAGALRREAEETSPPFSSSLHARVMRGIDAAESSIPQHRHSNIFRIAIPLAVAAIVLLAVGIWFRQPATPPPTPTIVMAVPPTMPRVDEMFGKAALSADKNLQIEMEKGQLAYLDQDARNLADFVIDRLRITDAGK